MNIGNSRELSIAIEAVRQAARLCQAVQSEITPDVLAKKDRSPVTVADFGSQALVCRALHEAFARDPIVAEEDSSDLEKPENSGILDQVVQRVRTIESHVDRRTVCEWISRGHSRQYCERFWTLDPIDGTKGFLRREQYAISVALICDGQIEVGVVGCPNLAFEESGEIGAIAYAVRGQGAWIEPMQGAAAATRIRVSARFEMSQVRFCESVESGHSSHGDAAAIAERLGIVQPPLRMDSQAKYAVVARGEADAYLRLPTRADYQEKIWDHAGGVLIVTEAGGMVTDVAGKALEFTHGPELSANRGVIVTNGKLHERVLAALNERSAAR
jgi:3'(2'), 5'-bisphosphate nucleotidase